MTQPRLLGGRYELDGVIGRGGMAEVYRARDLRLDRIVAIKTLRSDLARDPTFQARFRREAQSAASLNHPSVIAVYDTGEDILHDSPVPYIVMEFADGHTLRDLLRENRRLVPEKALEIVDGILRALDYSHRGGIVHRDIKPANVMLTRNHEVKVMDFGIARAMGDSAATMTQTAQVIGTAQYLSPEQARGERVDARSDLYSTGCVLYELLTGRPPFTGDSPVAIAYQHVREEPIPPSQVDPNIPKWCDAMVLKAMAKDPAHRYQSAPEFRQDIQRAMQGMPVSAPETNSTMVMGGATAVMGGNAGYAQTQVQRPVPGQPTDYGIPPVRQEDDWDDRRGGAGKKVALWLVLALLFIGGAAGLGMMLTNGSGGGAPKATTSTSVSAGAAQVNVPDVTGKTQAEATALLTAQKLKVGQVTQQNDPTVPKGQVISTNPAAGSPANQGDSIDLTISKGKAISQVQVPDVSNQDVASAKATLEGSGFKVTTHSQANSSVPAGTVISTNPPAGTTVPQGSHIILNVSSGKQQVAVPNVIGLTLAQAKQELVAKGLVPGNVTEVPQQGTDAPGHVVAVNPGVGTMVDPGTSVDLSEIQAQSGFTGLPTP
jgi:serine/threonine-protein kinase